MAVPDKNELIGSSVTESQFKLNLGVIVDFLKYVENQNLTVGLNIFDASKVTVGKYVDYLSGNLGNNPSFSASDFCEISPNTDYRVPYGYYQQLAFYDDSRTYISGLANVFPTYEFITPPNSKYVRFTIDTDSVSTFMVCKSLEFPVDYVPYLLTKNGLTVDADLIKNLPIKIKEWLGFNSINIVDTRKIIAGKYVVYSNGLLGDNSDFVAAGPYPVKPNTLYKVSSNYVQQFAFYDENMVYISGLANPDVNSQFTTPANAKFAKFSIQSAILNAVVIAENSLFPAAYVPYTLNIENLQLTRGQVLNNIDDIQVGLGFDPVNIIDPTKVIQDKYIVYTTGGLGNNNDFVATEAYEIKPSTEYQTSSFYVQQFAFYDEDGVYISGLADPGADKKFTTPANAKFIRLSVPKTQLSTLVVAESDIFPDSYASHNVKIAKDLIVGAVNVKNTDIFVSADVSDTSAAFTGKNAIQLALNSITDAGPNNRYTIRAKKGLYKVDQAADFIGYIGYPAMIEMKDYVDIVGQGEDNTIVWAELPHNDGDIGPSFDGNTYPRNQYQTVYNFAKEATAKDITFVAKNLRYTLHQDNPKGANTQRWYENVGWVFKGDKGSLNSLGIGTFEGEETYLEGGKSVTDNGAPFACHNNIAFNKPSLFSFKSYNFTSITNKVAIFLQSDGSLLQDKLNLVGCSFGGASYIFQYVDIWLTGNTAQNRDTFNHAEWNVFGHGNDPFLFDNTISSGLSLRIRSNATGAGTSIRFDKNSSAYPLLIKNNQANSDASLYIDSREFVDGYIAQDGSVGLAAQAWGCKDLSEGAYLYDGGVNYTSLGVRLGNCSSLNKTLGVVVNGVLNNVLFDKDYTVMTNAQIVTEINTKLSGATADLYIYGRDYFPTMPDVAETVYNASATYIPKGSVVAKSNGTVRLANGTDTVYGIALDNIPVMSTTSDGVKKGQGRVLKRGYIYSNQSKAHFVLADNQNPAVGTRFSVNNGQLVTDANGKISVDIDQGVISINC